MTAAELYDILVNKISDHKMELSLRDADACFDKLLYALHTEGGSLVISECEVVLSDRMVALSGIIDLPVFAGKASLRIEACDGQDDDPALTGDVTLSCIGEYGMAEFFHGITHMQECPYRSFKLQYPMIKGRLEKLYRGFAISGTAVGSFTDECWEGYRSLCTDRMNFTAHYAENFRREGLLHMDVQTGASVEFMNRTASVNFALQTYTGDFGQAAGLATMLILEIVESNGQPAMRLQLPMFAKSEYIYADACFAPPLTIENIVDFLQSFLGIQTGPLFPEDTFLSSFGLKYVRILVENSISLFRNIKYAECVFGMSHPWETSVPGLTLSDFQVSVETSCWKERKNGWLSTVTAFADAQLSLGAKYMLYGQVKIVVPQMVIEGQLMFREAEEGEADNADCASLSGLADGVGAAFPESWKGENKFVSVSVSVDAKQHILIVTGEAENILTIKIGEFEISLQNIGFMLTRAPSGSSFGIDGTVAIGAGDERFGIRISAQYEEGWSFRGALEYGRVKLGVLLMQMFGVKEEHISEGAPDIVLDGLEIEYSVRSGRLYLYAEFSAGWFDVLGIQPRLGGLIRLSRNDKSNDLEASAVMYLTAGIFTLLVQADDFYSDQRRFLIRLLLGDFCLQGVVSQNKKKENILTVSMGGMTLGQMVESFIHLINPNDKARLAKPWDILHKISLSAFSLTLNLTQKKKTAVFWVEIGLSIPGLANIEKIGLRYEGEGIKYVLAGSLLGEEYTQAAPYAWDAQNDTPPLPAAQKTKINYVGIGQHLDVDIIGSDLPAILQNLSKQLKPGRPTVSYREDNGFMFAVDFVIADWFRFQAALIDPELYGGRIEVCAPANAPLAALNGLILELIYRQVSNDVGMFACTMVVPEKFQVIELGAVTIYLGRISMEIYTNGSFFIDLGFPHDGDFSHSFGVEFGIYAGRGGIYIGVLKGDAVREVPAVKDGSFSPVVLLGVGVSIGLSRSFDLGIVKGGVSLMLTGIFEGVLGFYHPHDGDKEALYYRVKAMAAIGGSLFLSVDFKVITIRASAQISASCMLTLESYQQSVVELELALEVSAHIKVLGFKIDFSFSFHQNVSFLLAPKGTAPWTLAEGAYSKNSVFYPEIEIGRKEKLFPVTKLGCWEIAVDLIPLISVRNPTEEKREYIAVLLGVCKMDSFSKIAEMLTEWLLCNAKDGMLYSHHPLVANDRAEQQLTMEDLYGFLERNLKLRIGIRLEKEEEEKEEKGVHYPMPTSLILHTGEKTICYAENVVDKTYLEELAAYFTDLNTDPWYKAQKQIADDVLTADNEMIALGDCITLDYYRMLLSGFISRVKALFAEITVQADDLAVCAQQYDADLEEILRKNPSAAVGSIVLPEMVYVLNREDTLEHMQKMCKTPVWDILSGKTGILRRGAELSVDIDFENTEVNLTAGQAAAFFYVRYRQGDIFYMRHTDRVLDAGKEANIDGMADAGWECRIPCGKELELTLDSGEAIHYKVLMGDTVVRIAKMLALLDGGGKEDPEWGIFREAFLHENGEDGKKAAEYAVLECYHVSCSAQIGDDNSPASLYRRIYPYYAPESDVQPELCSLWQQEIFEPLREVVLKDVSLPAKEGGRTLGELTSVYGMDTICEAVRQNGIHLSEMQDLIIPAPGKIPDKEVRSHLIDTAEGMGAMVSRFFLQGLRVPKPDSMDGEMIPLYELLCQQIDLDVDSDLHMRLEPADNACSWIYPDTQEVIWTQEQIHAALPEQVFPDRELPELLPACICQNGYQSLYDTCLVDGAESAVFLPQGCREEFKTFISPPKLLCDGREQKECKWAAVFPVAVMRIVENVYLVKGVTAGERRRLLELQEADVERLSIAFIPSWQMSGQRRMVCASDGDCVLVKTNLSVETHMGVAVYERSVELRDSRKYCAGLENAKGFLGLLWQCSVIGGGFILYCEGIPSDVFEEDGSGTLHLIVRFKDFESARDKAGCILVTGRHEEYVLVEEEKQVYVPAQPAGCVGLKTTLPENSEVSELYQIMSYRVQMDGRMMESAPVIPQKQGDTLSYLFTIPLYRLADRDNVYSSVGKTYVVEIGLRDVLGNYVKNGELTLTGMYNDELVSVGEYPCTRFFYDIFEDSMGMPRLKIVIVYTGRAEEDNEAAAGYALTAMKQLGCPDIEVSVTCSVDDEEHVLNTQQMAQLCGYVKELYDALMGNRESVEERYFDIPLHSDKKQEIYQFRTGITISRPSEKCGDSKDERIFKVTTLLPSSEEMRVLSGFAGVWLAEGSDGIYCVPETYIQSLKVTPYECYGLKTPAFYAMRPFSQSRITGRQMVKLYGGEQEERSYTDCDINLWMERFLHDVEQLLGGREVCLAAIHSSEQLDRLVEAKRRIALACAGRICSLCEEFPRSSYVQGIFREHYMASLVNISKIDVAASWQADFQTCEFCRAELELTGSMVMLPEKLSSRQNEFGLCSYHTDRKNTQEKITVKLQNLEYQIEEGKYDSSEWLRLHTPLKTEEIDLSAEYGIPHPLRVCPATPVLCGQSWSADEYLHWNYRLELSCVAREQYTLYICFSMGTEPAESTPDRNLFAVLADYDCQREELLGQIENAENEGFREAYEKMASFAEEAASVLEEEAGKMAAGIEKENIRSDVRIEDVVLAVNFTINDTGQIEGHVREETSILTELGISLAEVEILSADLMGDVIRFVLGINGIPIFRYDRIQSYVHMVQNADLFPKGTLQLRKEFLFTSAEVGTELLHVQPEYYEKFSVSTVEEAAVEVWNRLHPVEMKSSVQVDMEIIFCCHMKDDLIGLSMRMPVTLFLPVQSEQEMTDQINAWFGERCYRFRDGGLECRAKVYDESGKRLFSAVFEIAYEEKCRI